MRTSTQLNRSADSAQSQQPFSPRFSQRKQVQQQPLSSLIVRNRSVAADSFVLNSSVRLSLLSLNCSDRLSLRQRPVAMSVSASDQDALVAHFASIVNSSDIPACRAMLETHQWKLDEAVATQLAMAQAQMPDHNSPTAATSTQTSALLQPSSSSFNQNNQSHAASDQSMLTERLLPNSASASSASSSAAAPLSGHNFMSHAATVRARGATNAHARPQSVPPTAAAWYTLLPGSAFISRTIAVIASLFQSLLPSSGGATQNRQSPVDAAAQHLSFVHELTQQWPSAPPFVAASYGEAITRAKTRRKPLFIYLHSESAAGTQPFLRDVLCTEGVASFLSANCVSFAGSLSHLSTFRLGQQLR